MSEKPSDNLMTFVARYPSCMRHGGENTRGCPACEAWRADVDKVDAKKLALHAAGKV